MGNVYVLSIDGGGARAIVSAVVLERLEGYLRKNSGKNDIRIADCFDLVAGTSAGAILAASLVCPGVGGKAKYSAGEVLKLFLENFEGIFEKRAGQSIKTLFGLLGARYSNQKLKEVLKKHLGDTRLSQTVTPCMITAYDTEKGEAVFFSTLSAKKGAARDYYLRDAVLSSAAAPTYFSPALVASVSGEKRCLIDGGVFASNPALCAFAEAFKLPKSPGPDNIRIVSVGNLRARINLAYDTIKSWGVAQWAKPLFDIIMDANSQTVDYQLRRIYEGIRRPGYYIRFELKGVEDVPSMDDVSSKAVSALIERGVMLADEAAGALERLAVEIITEKGI